MVAGFGADNTGREFAVEDRDCFAVVVEKSYFGGRVFDWRAEEEVLCGELNESAHGGAYNVVFFSNDSDYYTVSLGVMREAGVPFVSKAK
jgi:hypothetical protein